MRKVIMMVMVGFLLISGIAMAEFQGVDWGEKRGAIFMEEGTDYYDSLSFGARSYLTYSRELLGSNVKVQYELRNERLRFGYIVFLTNVDVDRIRNALTSSYGEASENIFFDFDPEKAGFFTEDELNQEIIESYMFWATSDTAIGMFVIDSGQAMIVYYDREWISPATAESDAGSL